MIHQHVLVTPNASDNPSPQGPCITSPLSLSLRSLLTSLPWRTIDSSLATHAFIIPLLSTILKFVAIFFYPFNGPEILYGIIIVCFFYFIIELNNLTNQSTLSSNFHPSPLSPSSFTLLPIICPSSQNLTLLQSPSLHKHSLHPSYSLSRVLYSL